MRFYYFFLSLLFFTAGTACGRTQKVYFGGENGSPAFGYLPSTFSVNVGDTIIWIGTLSSHPLSLVQAPAGATTFSHITSPNNGANGYMYVVMVAGNNYAFHCDFHYTLSPPMAGTFTVSTAGVEPPADTKLMMDPIYPNPMSMESMVHFTLKNSGHVTLRVFDATGKLAMTTLDEEMDAGFHMATIDTKQLASGSYQYVLQQGDAVLRREMIVVK